MLHEKSVCESVAMLACQATLPALQSQGPQLFQSLSCGLRLKRSKYEDMERSAQAELFISPLVSMLLRHVMRHGGIGSCAYPNCVQHSPSGC